MSAPSAAKPTKQEQLAAAVRLFEIGERTPRDYQNLFATFMSCTRQGSGLEWDQIEAAVQSGLESIAALEAEANAVDRGAIDRSPESRWQELDAAVDVELERIAQQGATHDAIGTGEQSNP